MRASKRGICDASSDVCSSYLLAIPEGDAVALVSDLRHGRLGVNPYLPIILTSWESDMQLVRRVVDAGADDLLVKPLSTRIILDRIETVALHRKPFVVTSDYIGQIGRASCRERVCQHL